MFKKLKLYKSCFIEILETLCTFCLYFEEQSRRNHSRYSDYFKCHFVELKRSSIKLRGGEDNDKT